MKKEELVQFLSKAAKLETQAWDWQTQAEQTRQNAANEFVKCFSAHHDAEMNFSKHNEEYEQQKENRTNCENELKDLRDRYARLRKKKLTKEQKQCVDAKKSAEKSTIGSWIGFFVGVSINGMWALMIALLSVLLGEPDFIAASVVWFLFLVLPLGIIGAVIGGAIGKNTYQRKAYYEMKKQQYKEEITEAEHTLTKLNKLCDNLYAEWERLRDVSFNAQQALNESKASREFDEIIAQEYDTKANALLEEVGSLYNSTNVLPAEYQNRETVCALSHIFQCDLADTLREAILLHEQRNNWIELRNHLDHHITKELKEIWKNTIELQDIGNKVFSIEYNLKKVSGSLKEANEIKQELVEQNRALRYAVMEAQRRNEQLAEAASRQMDEKNEHLARLENYAAEWDWERRNT